MLLLKVRLGKKFYKRGTKDRLVKRFDVTRLRGPRQDSRGRELLKEKFVSGVHEELKKSWAEAGSIQEKWDAIKWSLCEQQL